MLRRSWFLLSHNGERRKAGGDFALDAMRRDAKAAPSLSLPRSRKGGDEVTASQGKVMKY